MKKIFLATLILAATGTSSWAGRIYIDIQGSGTVTKDGNRYTVNCCSSADCCGTITIEMPSSSPMIGDPTTIEECNGTAGNVIHRWHGQYVSMDMNTDEIGTQGTLDLSNIVQEF